ncbi:hypothetical protein [Coxiella-like endosymbiont]|uniref:hypothetical protein n=1 Tax=Coxiella-like endosymbiont TaxID=1592897 RepID=UPI00272BCAFB|nr:hypothetical protein [Coxiella-like endosymbiont]
MSDKLSVNKFRSVYLETLNSGYQKQKIFDQLFQINGDVDKSKNIYFDRFSFKNAKNKSFWILLIRIELEKISDYQKLTPVQKYDFLQEAFEKIGEST